MPRGLVLCAVRVPHLVDGEAEADEDDDASHRPHLPLQLPHPLHLRAARPARPRRIDGRVTRPVLFVATRTTLVLYPMSRDGSTGRALSV